MARTRSKNTTDQLVKLEVIENTASTSKEILRSDSQSSLTDSSHGEKGVCTGTEDSGEYTGPDFFLNPKSPRTEKAKSKTPPNQPVPESPKGQVHPDPSPEPEFPTVRQILTGTQDMPSSSQVSAPSSTQRPKPTPTATRGRPTPSSQTATSSTSTIGKRKTPPETTNRSSQRAQNNPPNSTTKRSRHDNADSRKSREFWHLDGSVVIQIQNTVFKLYRSHLARQSAFFRDLFDRGRASAETTDDGSSDAEVEREDAERVPSQFDACDQYVIRITTAEDFEQLLAFLDDAISYAFAPPQFGTLASVMRASTALGFVKAREWATRVLAEMWPESLDKVDDNRIPYATASILLARQCDLPQIPKRAYYELLRATAFQQDLLDDVNDGAVSGISTKDLLRLVNAREHLVREWMTTISPPPSFASCAPVAPEPAEDNDADTEAGSDSVTKSDLEFEEISSSFSETPECISDDKEHCDLRWLDIVRSEDFQVDDFLHDPIMGLQYLIELDWESEGFCKECADLRRNTWRRQRERLWANLDVWLSLQ